MYTSAGPVPIQVSEILAYFHVMGIVGLEERREYLKHIQRLDTCDLNAWAASRPSGKK
jgi:hypothetical protein